MTFLWVALGGALGAMARFWLGTTITRFTHQLSAQSTTPHWGSTWPWGTLSVNVLGSFLIGIAYVLLLERDGANAYNKLLFMTGFLGAFTTFSTFSLDTLLLLQQQHWSSALLHALVSLLVCLGATALGMVCMRLL